MTTQIVRGVCSKDCPDACGLLSHVEDGNVVKVVGDPDHPITQGFLCARYQHYEEIVNHPDRLLYPLARDSRGEFRRVSWDDALDRIATRFGEISERYGGDAILPYHYLGHLGIVAGRSADRLWNKMNTARVGMEVCAMAGAEAVIRVVGQIRGTEPRHLDKTRLYVAWGKNPKSTNVHGWVLTKDIHPQIVIDPFQSESALAADLYIQPRPATDSMLAIGLMRILIENDWIDSGYIESRTTGFEALRAKVMSTDLAEVERVTGVPRSQMLQFAELYHEHQPGLIHIGVGLQRNSNGGEMVAAICMLGALTGQIGTRGGGVLYANMEWALNDISYSGLRTSAPVMHNMVKLGRDLTESDAIKALYVYNQNPAATIPNQNLVRAGLRRDDLFVVVHDLFMTDTARLADIVLPATTYAESADLHLSYWHDYVRINTPAIEPMGEARSNHWVFSHIGQRMGYQESCFYQSEDEVIEEALVGTGLDPDELRRRAVLWADPEGTSFDDGRFPTPSGRLTMVVPDFTAPPEDPHRYRFITPKSAHLQGSQVFNVPRKWSALRQPLLMLHPDDAAAEGIGDGDAVRVWNGRGEVTLIAHLSSRCQPGVVVSYMVRWGDNANTTTSDTPADMGGNSTFHTNFVSLARLGQGEPVPSGAESVAEAGRLVAIASRG